MLEISGAGEEKSEIPLEIRHKVTVNCSPDVAYKFCKDLHQAARMLSDSQQLTSDAGHWNWTWQGPAGMKMSCQVELVEDRPNTLLAWKSLANSPLQTIAEMHFHGTPGNQTTEVHLRLEIMPPGGLIGKTAGTLVKPMISSQIREHLCRLKGILESSESTASGRSPEEEVASSAAQPTRRTSMPASVTDPVEGASQKSFPASDAPSRFTAQSGPKIPDELRHKATGK